MSDLTLYNCKSAKQEKLNLKKTDQKHIFKQFQNDKLNKLHIIFCYTMIFINFDYDFCFIYEIDQFENKNVILMYYSI